MPYRLDDFPIETSEPQIDVELSAGDPPEGTSYTFELVVEDSAGYQSLVDVVTITVVKKSIPLPEVTWIKPDFVTLGTQTKATISGKNLATIKAVQFLQGDDLEPRVFAVIDSVQDDLVYITITAHGRAPFKDPYYIEVITQAGRVRWDKVFTVARKPEIEDFAPKSLDVGERADPFIVRGRHLRMEEPHPLTVEFMDGDDPDPHFDVQIKPESKPEMLVLVVTARKDDDKLKPGDRQLKLGDRQLRITTPAGSDTKKGFKVTQEK